MKFKDTLIMIFVNIVSKTKWTKNEKTNKLVAVVSSPPGLTKSNLLIFLVVVLAISVNFI